MLGFQVTVYVMEACSPSDLRRTPSRTFRDLIRPFGETLYVPKDAHSIAPLAKTIAISTEKGIVIADPSNITKQMVSVVPNFGGAASTTDIAQPKTLCEEAKPLGLIRTESGEIIVIYDNQFPFHIIFEYTSSYLNNSSWMLHHEAWSSLPEKRIHPLGDESYHFCISRVPSLSRRVGLIKVIEGFDIRLLLHTNLESNSSSDNLLVAMRGDKDHKDGVSDKIIELVQTSKNSAIQTPITSTPIESLWDEWDM